MDSLSIQKLLDAVSRGGISVTDAMGKLRDLPSEDLGFARIDHHRHLRSGIPEVVFASGKKPEEAAKIGRAIYDKSGSVLITRGTEEIRKKLRIRGAKFHPASCVIVAGGAKEHKGRVLVLTAGTSDIPVAEEAALTAEFMGSTVVTRFDVGVAGIHRLFEQRPEIEQARVIIVVAGMEGALPSVVGGLASCPIVAVPTSVGYGTSLGGITALFAMLNSCVPGIAVVNIDNGFGAGCLAHKINAPV